MRTFLGIPARPRPPGRDVLLDPARLCRGTATVARDRGVIILGTSLPIPFLSAPLRSLAIDVVRGELDRADRNEGRRSLILRALDAVGIGFDS